MKSQYQIWDERTTKFWIANIILAVIMLVAFIFDMYLWIKLVTFLIYAICSVGALYCDSKRIEAKIKDKFKDGDDA
jgi:membrane protein implicated in regulation of membrane protease activity